MTQPQQESYDRELLKRQERERIADVDWKLFADDEDPPIIISLHFAAPPPLEDQ